jgi:hypothetical protein
MTEEKEKIEELIPQETEIEEDNNVQRTNCWFPLDFGVFLRVLMYPFPKIPHLSQIHC